MDEKLKQLESLLSMFDARDQMWAKHNRQIGNVIAPTVLEAIYELLELDHDAVEWVDLQIMENIMLIVCNVTYDPATTRSQFLNRVDEANRPDTPIQVQRFLRIGVPLAIVFADKADIKEFLLRIPVETTEDDNNDVEIETSSNEDDTPSSTPTRRKSSEVMGFDTADLSDDQITKLMLYHHAIETTKQ